MTVASYMDELFVIGDACGRFGVPFLFGANGRACGA